MPASPGYTLITSSQIQDASGRLLAKGKVTFTPVTNLGNPTSAIAAGGGAISVAGVSFLVVNGAITTDLYGNAPQLADTSLTVPRNICYQVSISDANGVHVQGPGYQTVQPFGATWSLDSYSSSFAPIPTGPSNLIFDSVTGISYFFSVNMGVLTLFPSTTGSGTPTSVVFADLSNGQNYALTFKNGARTINNIGTLGSAVPGISFVDQDDETKSWTLQFSNGSPQWVGGPSTSSSLQNLILADIADGSLKTLSFIGGAFTTSDSPTSVVFADVVNGLYYQLSIVDHVRTIQPVPATSAAVDGLTLIDQGNSGNRYTLQFVNGSLDYTVASSTTPGVGFYTMADLATGADVTLSFVNGSLRY